MYRPTIATISLNNIVHNYNEMKKKAYSKKVMAVIKSNAYGHGIVEVAKRLEEEKADMFAVSSLDEAMVLRNNGIQTRVMVIGWTPSEFANVASENDVELTAFQTDWIKSVGKLENPLKIHLKVGTGMNRLGIKTEEEFQGFANEFNKRNDIKLQGIFTHFATADESDSSYVQFQQIWWEQLTKNLPQNVDVHIANSAYGWKYPNGNYDMVRLGISLYGYAPSDSMMLPNLKPALSLTSVVSHIKKIKKGERVGYGATYEAKEDEWIATIPIGYGDGILRRYAEKGEVLINGKRRKIVGRICMDQLMVRVSEDVSLGDEVVFIGEQGNEKITADEIAKKSGTINYEILCNLSERITRKYI